MSLSHITTAQDLPHRLRQKLESELKDNERVLWVGRPNAGRAACREILRAAIANFFAILVGSGLMAITKMWEFVYPAEPPWPWLWWIAWGAQGLAAFSILWRVLFAYRKAGGRVYAITDLRALECSSLLFSPGYSIQRQEVELVRARLFKKGQGEIIFEPFRDNGPGSRNRGDEVRFEFLDDVGPARSAVEVMLGREIPEEKFGAHSGKAPASLNVLGENDLSHALQDRLVVELVEGERVLWTGRPPPGVMALRVAFPLGCLLILVMTCAGVFGVVAGFITPHMPDGAWNRWVSVLPWMMAPFAVLLAVFTMLGTLSAWYCSRRTAYVITDRRALLVQVGLGGRVYSFGRTALGNLQVRELENGSGEIIFEEKVRVSYSESGSENRHTHVIGFIEVARVEPARLALEKMMGRPVVALKVSSVSLNQHHTIG